jgi:DNA helicase-2/ATP-dependent DNA helicase PcrA
LLRVLNQRPPWNLPQNPSPNPKRPIQLSDKQREIMAAVGHLLVTGGPGSGKTTVAILKAADITNQLRTGQLVLFLSFARATVSRVIEAIEHEQQIPRDQQRRIEVDTYHSFFWRILKTHGYLVGLPRRLFILTYLRRFEHFGAAKCPSGNYRIDL